MGKEKNRQRKLNMEKNNIILVGMPSCGKSTVGVILEKTMGMDFIDTDILIQKEQGMTLQKIIDSKGEEEFYRIEEGVLSSYKGKGQVVATGGSAIYYEKAMAHLAEMGTIIYLKVSLDTVLKRLDNISTRGVPMKEGMTLEKLYDQRIPLYESRSHVTVEADGMTVEQVVAEIVRAVSNPMSV